jgi:NADPH2:quinone reductase
VIAVEVRAFGGPDLLRLVERDEPRPGAGEVLVRVEAVGLNWSDLLQRAGDYPGGPVPPFIAGQEAAATVVEHGPGVAAPPIGAQVSVIAPSGLCAELAVVPASACHVWPVALAADQRAALPIALVTAQHALVTCARAAAGEVAVIHAAAGGVGSIAVQVARELGLVTIGTCSAAKRAYVIADRVCGYDELREPVDVGLDGVGGAAFRATCRVLRPNGRIVLIGASSGEPQRVDAIALVHRSQSVIGMHLRHVAIDRALAGCAPFVAKIHARTTIMPMRDIAAAHAQLAARAIAGKLVLSY